MDKLLSSRTRQDQELISVGNLSPQKYGRSAFCHLQYTPSKLADNVLYKQVTALKKVQQQSCKTRQFQAINDCLMDRLKYMQQQKNVIISSLNQQITVYKKIIKEMQTKNQDRIKQLQRKFKQQLTKIINSKQEEVKFVQSEKELLENRIQQLERQKLTMQQKIDSHDRSVSDLRTNYQKLQKQVQNLNFRIKQKNQQINQLQQLHRIQKQDLHRKLLDNQLNWKNQLRQALNRKQIQIQSIQKSHHQQISKYEQLRTLQSQSYKKQTSDIIHSYQKQLKKLSQLLANKQRIIQNLSRDHKQEKSKNLSLTKTYQSQLTDLTNVKLINNQLEKENQKLRDLLIQSSKQLERCRQEFLILDKQNSTLRIKVKSADQQARTWRESYYLAKRT